MLGQLGITKLYRSEFNMQNEMSYKEKAEMMKKKKKKMMEEEENC